MELKFSIYINCLFFTTKLLKSFVAQQTFECQVSLEVFSFNSFATPSFALLVLVYHYVSVSFLLPACVFIVHNSELFFCYLIYITITVFTLQVENLIKFLGSLFAITEGLFRIIEFFFLFMYFRLGSLLHKNFLV